MAHNPLEIEQHKQALRECGIQRDTALNFTTAEGINNAARKAPCRAKSHGHNRAALAAHKFKPKD